MTNVPGPSCLLVAAILVSAPFADAAPVLAQPAASGAQATSLYAGPHVGLSLERNASPEFGLRLAARRERRSWDASLASFSVRFEAPSSRGRIFEGLLGTAWRLRAGSVAPFAGPRGGIVLTTNRFGERSVAGVLGSHVGLEADVWETLSIRGEGGFSLYLSGSGTGAPRGFLRVGLERRLR